MKSAATAFGENMQLFRENGYSMEKTGIFVEIKGICRVALTCMIFSIIASKHLIKRGTVHVDGRTNWKNKPVKRDLTWPWPIVIIMFSFVYKNLEILLSTLFFSSRALMVTGRVAELEAVPKAVTIAFPMFAMNLREKICFSCKFQPEEIS